MFVNHRPNVLGRHGQAYYYDSDLLLVGSVASFSRSAILNEFSQGNGQSKEWIEILLLKDADVRGWNLADRQGAGLTFSATALWSNLPAGTLLVVYNGADRDTVLPPDDPDPADGALVISSTSATHFSGSWGALGNSGDSILLRNAASVLVDALSYSSDVLYDPKLPGVGSSQSAHYNGDTEAGADVAANWQVAAAAAGTVTPAAGNGATNAQFVAGLRQGIFNQPALFRFATNSDLPPGLTLDATNGVISGTLNAPTGGLYRIILERFTVAAVVTQQFTLLVGGTNRVYPIAAGQSWAMNTNAALDGTLLVRGSLDTAGRTLIVSNTLDVSGGTISNATGLILYHRLVGGPLPVQARSSTLRRCSPLPASAQRC